MEANRFAAAAIIIGEEGGYSDNPADAGGPTKFGITLATLRRHQPDATIEDVINLTQAAAGDIYEAEYWPAIQGDALPSGVDLLLFDSAVNCGPGMAAKFLQRALGVTADGVIGPNTLAATNAMFATNAAGLIQSVAGKRNIYYRSLSSFFTFGDGWLRRVATITQTAISWAQKTV